MKYSVSKSFVLMLRRQAQRDAVDAAAGYSVDCPHITPSLIRVWTKAFQTQLKEQR